MGRKIKGIIISIASLFFLFSNVKQNEIVNTSEEEIQFNDEVNKANETTSLTVEQIANFLGTKNAHYPLSDEFIERYQQNSGGYIEYARKLGKVVDKTIHEPDQKWHFLVSWYDQSVAEDPNFGTYDAKSRVYTNLKCPELLLWIYEACGVEPSKVQKAKEVAELAKVNSVNVTTMAASMRKCVSWEDLTKNIEIIDNPKEEYLVKAGTVKNASILYNNEVFAEKNVKNGETFSFNVSVNEGYKIVSVKVNGTLLKPENDVYSFVVKRDSTIDVLTTKTVISESGSSYNISFDLGTRITSKKLSSNDEIENTFTYASGEDIFVGVTSFENIYGGGYSASGESKWYAGNMLKFGTTQVLGNLTISLKKEISGIKLSGYIHASKATIRVGDASSTVWSNSSSDDNKTTLMSLSNMTVVNKNVIEEANPSTIEIDFEKTSELRIATTVASPLYLTAIEFIF